MIENEQAADMSPLAEDSKENTVVPPV